METYLLGSAIAFGLTIVVMLIQQAIYLPLSQYERWDLEVRQGHKVVTIKDALANALISWVGVVMGVFVLFMVAVTLFTSKK